MAVDTRRSVLLRFCRRLMQAQQKCQSDCVDAASGRMAGGVDTCSFGEIRGRWRGDLMFRSLAGNRPAGDDA